MGQRTDSGQRCRTLLNSGSGRVNGGSGGRQVGVGVQQREGETGEDRERPVAGWQGALSLSCVEFWRSFPC